MATCGFDLELRLTHESTRAVLADLLETFSRWIGREQAAAVADCWLAPEQERTAGTMEPPKG